MRRSTISILIALILAGPAVASTVAELQQQSSGLSEQDRLWSQVEIYRSEARDGTGDHGTFPTLLRLLKSLAQELGKEGTVEAAREANALENEMAQVAARWVERFPQQIAGYLALLRQAEQESDVSGILRRIEARFGESFHSLDSTAHELRSLGWSRAASALLEGYLERQPDDPLTYAALVEDYRNQKAYSRSGALAGQWFERFPRDADARRSHLLHSHLEMSREQITELADQVLDSVVKPEEGYICFDLESATAIDQAAKCWKKVEAGGAHLRYDHMKSLIRAFAAQGDAEALVEVALERGSSWQQSIVAELEKSGYCEVLDGYLAGIGDGDVVGGPQASYLHQTIIQAMTRCNLAGAAEKTLAALRAASANDLSGLMTSQRLQAVELEAAEEVLLERIYLESGETKIHQAVAHFYRNTGESEKLLAHAIDWSSHVAMDPEPPLLVAERLMSNGQLDQALPWVEEFLRRQPKASSDYSRAVDLLLNLGETTWGSGIATRLMASEEKYLASQGHRQLLKIASENGELSAEIAHFRAIKEANQVRTKDKIGYAERMRAEGRVAEVVAEIETDVLARYSEGKISGIADAAFGRELSQYGLWQHAAERLRSALIRAPENVEVKMGLAEALSQLGDAEGAERVYREVLQLSPLHPKALEKLAFLIQKREDFAAIVALLKPAAEALGTLEGQSGLILGHAQLRLERHQAALEQFEKTAWQQPGNYQAQLNLGGVYDLLERKEEAEGAFRRFLRMTAWNETRVGGCDCACGLAGQRAAAREWLKKNAADS